jgi:hypothetical protein
MLMLIWIIMIIYENWNETRAKKKQIGIYKICEKTTYKVSEARHSYHYKLGIYKQE